MKPPDPAKWNAMRARSVAKYQAKQKLKPRKPIRKVSIKRIEKDKIYQARAKSYKRLHPVCEFPGCNSREIDLHHKKGRVGDLLIDDRYFCSLCRTHHVWVHSNIDESKKMGLLLDQLTLSDLTNKKP